MTRSLLAVLLSTTLVPVPADFPPRANEAAVKLVVAPSGNVARYRVREQLVGFDLPNDAVGETQAVTGAIALDSTGAVIPAESRITVNVTGLKSDRERRDAYLQSRTLETSRFPTVELAVTRVRGIPVPLPASGKLSFTLEGNLTVKGVSRPTTWAVDADFSAGSVTGKAVTRFTFQDFELAQPRVRSVLSVADTIGLEYDFTLLRESDDSPGR